MHLNHCGLVCFRVGLAKATKLISCLGILFGLLGSALGSYLIVNSTGAVILDLLIVLFVISCVVTVILSVFLLYGAVSRRPSFFLPSFVFKCLFIPSAIFAWNLFMISWTVLSLQMDQDSDARLAWVQLSVLIGVDFVFVLLLYFWFVEYSFYLQIKREEQEGGIRQQDNVNVQSGEKKSPSWTATHARKGSNSDGQSQSSLPLLLP